MTFCGQKTEAVIGQGVIRSCSSWCEKGEVIFYNIKRQVSSIAFKCFPTGVACKLDKMTTLVSVLLSFMLEKKINCVQYLYVPAIHNLGIDFFPINKRFAAQLSILLAI